MDLKKKKIRLLDFFVFFLEVFYVILFLIHL